MSKGLKVSNDTVEASGKMLGMVSSKNGRQLCRDNWFDGKEASSDSRRWNRHRLATVPDSPLLFKSSSFLCCCGVRSL